ncbi:MAG: hypothetical protein AAGL68_00135 [Pseudomonadota bacterium]
MPAPLLLGFVADPAPQSVPDSLAIASFDACGAVISDQFEPGDLQQISKHLLALQHYTPVVPMRPAPVPADLAERMAVLTPKLAENFALLGKAVEFVIQFPVDPAILKPAETDPKDYLRNALASKQNWQRASQQELELLGGAIAALESDALASKLGEPNVKGLGAKHYLMNGDHSSQVINQWRGHLGNAVGSKAVLAGPWAPYSFVELGD